MNFRSSRKLKSAGALSRRRDPGASEYHDFDTAGAGFEEEASRGPRRCSGREDVVYDQELCAADPGHRPSADTVARGRAKPAEISAAPARSGKDRRSARQEGQLQGCGAPCLGQGAGEDHRWLEAAADPAPVAPRNRHDSVGFSGHFHGPCSHESPERGAQNGVAAALPAQNRARREAAVLVEAQAEELFPRRRLRQAAMADRCLS